MMSNLPQKTNKDVFYFTVMADDISFEKEATNIKMLNEIKHTQDLTFHSIKNIKTTLNSTEKLGMTVLDELRRQTEAVDSNIKSFEELDKNLKKSKELQQKFSRWSCICLDNSAVIDTSTKNIKKVKKSKGKTKQKTQHPLVQTETISTNESTTTTNDFEILNDTRVKNKKIDHEIEEIDTMIDTILNLSNELNTNIKNTSVKIDEMNGNACSTLNKMIKTTNNIKKFNQKSSS